jgi:hypothetical protein
MRGHCPKCGSRYLRFSRVRSAREFLGRLFGVQAMRCGQCSHRFARSIWRFSVMRYAHCPRCLNMDLGYWSTHDYRPRWRTKFLLGLGAQPYRCGKCRCRFASFRPRDPMAKVQGRRQVYSWD